MNSHARTGTRGPDHWARATYPYTYRSTQRMRPRDLIGSSPVGGPYAESTEILLSCTLISNYVLEKKERERKKGKKLMPIQRLPKRDGIINALDFAVFELIGWILTVWSHE